MNVKEFYLKEWDWYIKIFYAIDTYYVDDILGDLESMGCKDEFLKSVEKLIIEKRTNIGITYSNLSGRCSIMIIGLTTSPAKFQKIKSKTIRCLLRQINDEFDRILNKII